ncbi:MAG: hypothetical protein IPH12_02525 [Saprospirales bacterium]|nr:hypothetical protein [Saprospirales bacterium]MBK8921481.1 hypothetical protein [Saprospirales bacterium]
MHAISLFRTSLLFSAIWISCTMPPDQAAPFPAETLPRRISGKLNLPDTAGIARAYAAFLKTVPTPERDRFAHPHWTLFAPVDTASGTIPCDIFEDDSLGFQVVFFNKTGGRFQFIPIRSAPASTVFPKSQIARLAGILSTDSL